MNYIYRELQLMIYLLNNWLEYIYYFNGRLKANVAFSFQPEPVLNRHELLHLLVLRAACLPAPLEFIFQRPPIGAALFHQHGKSVHGQPPASLFISGHARSLFIHGCKELPNCRIESENIDGPNKWGHTIRERGSQQERKSEEV